MTFNNQSSSTNITSQEIECNKNFNTLTSIFLELQKSHDYLKENTYDLNSMSSSKYREKRRELYSKLNNFPHFFNRLHETIALIETNLTEMNRLKINPSFQNKLKSSVESTKKRIVNIIDEAKVIEDALQKKDYSINTYEATLQDDGVSNMYMKSEQLIEKKESSNNIMKQKQVNDFRVSLIEVKEISSMESIQREREEELHKIHKVTGQIVDMTGMMKTEINKQGDLLDNIEDHVVDAKVNVIGADKEIKEADQIMKSTTKKIVCLVIAIIIIIAIILVLVFTVFV